MDPETLFSIAQMYERMQDMDEAAAYMELCVAQELGPMSDEDEGGPGGVGVTPTTSKARLWLAKWAFRNGQFHKSLRLASELCQDGMEFEETKALVLDLRTRMEHLD